MKRVGLSILCLFALGGTIPTVGASEYRTPAEMLKSCEGSPEFPDCELWVNEIAWEYCSASGEDIRKIAIAEAKDRVSAKLPMAKFIQRVLVKTPGCSLRTCPSDRMTYRSEDGKKEFVVEATGRGRWTRPFSGGKLTTELIVRKGQIGDQTYYLYDEVAVSNTGQESAKINSPPGFARGLDLVEPYKLTWRSWDLPYLRGKEAFHTFDDDLGVTWNSEACRVEPKCPPGWKGSCDGPPAAQN